MKISENKLRATIKHVLKELFLSRLLPAPDGKDEEEYSIGQRIGGGHTSRAAQGQGVDYGGWHESDEAEIDDDSEEEEEN